MKKIYAAVLSGCVMFLSSSTVFAAGWTICTACHNGRSAPGKEPMIEKYKTAEYFVRAAQASRNPRMKDIKKDEAKLWEVAREIGLK